MEPTRRQKIAVVILFFLFTAMVLPGIDGHVYDMFCFRIWGMNMNQHGLKMAYHSETDYPPVYQYFLWMFEKMVGTEKAVYEKMAYMRLVVLFFDAVGIWAVCRWAGTKTDKPLLFFMCILNPGFCYNTLIWGQVDGILSCWVFLSVWAMWRGKVMQSLLIMLLAINLKFQAIIFLPVLFLLLLHTDLKTKWKTLLLAVLVLLFAEVILVYPFILTETSRHNLWAAFFGAVGRFPYLSIYAFNVWSWHYSVLDGVKVKDTLPLYGSLSFKNAGLLLFFTSSFVILLPLLRSSIQYVFKSGRTPLVPFPREKLWAIAAAIPLVFFYFNTQMHERYSHPAFIFLIAYAVYTRDVIPFMLLSVACFLNLETELKWLKLANYDTLIFDPRFASSIYLVLIGYVLFRIYKPYKKGAAAGPAYTNSLPSAASV